jgi:hypothetical protein
LKPIVRESILPGYIYIPQVVKKKITFTVVGLRELMRSHQMVIYRWAYPNLRFLLADKCIAYGHSIKVEW